MPDLSDIGNSAAFNERSGVLTLHYKEDGRSTIETIRGCRDLHDAHDLILSQGWYFTEPGWAHSALEGYTIGITREEN